MFADVQGIGATKNKACNSQTLIPETINSCCSIIITVHVYLQNDKFYMYCCNRIHDSLHCNHICIARVALFREIVHYQFAGNINSLC